MWSSRRCYCIIKYEGFIVKCNNFELDFSEDLCFSEYKEDAFKALDFILNKNGLGNKFLGWVTHPEVFDREEYDRMKQLSEKVKKSEVLVVIGVGGSFLGSKAVIKALKPYFKEEGLEIVFPIMCAGIDTDAILLGANDGLEEYTKKSLDNISLKYAIIRNAMFKDENKEIEYLVAHEFKLSYLQEWWKQLFAESEGKNGKGLYVESAIFTRDLHSFGQMIQDGNKITFETIIEVENLKNDIIIPYIDEDFDNLNYLAKKSLNDINRVAVTATRKAHTDGNVPTVRIKIPKLDAYNIGKLIYFFEMSCAISAYMLEVNPFDQPGVDNYKKNMYQLLEKM